MALTRTRYKMPDYIRQTVITHALLDAYHARPDYQQNDYIGWILRAKRDATRERRLTQMLEELEHGDRYMKMKWRPKP